MARDLIGSDEAASLNFKASILHFGETVLTSTDLDIFLFAERLSDATIAFGTHAMTVDAFSLADGSFVGTADSVATGASFQDSAIAITQSDVNFTGENAFADRKSFRPRFARSMYFFLDFEV